MVGETEPLHFEFHGAYFLVFGLGVPNFLWGMALAVGYVAVEHFLRSERMETQIADVSLTVMLGSTVNESGNTLYSHVMLQVVALIVGALEKEQVDVVTVTALFNDIDRDIALFVTLAQNVDSNIRHSG